MNKSNYVENRRLGTRNRGENGRNSESSKRAKMKHDLHNDIEGIAVIGMAGRFPGAKNTSEFWLNLRDGLETITFFSDAELAAWGVDPGVLSNPNYVKARPLLEDVEMFDAAFFGYTQSE